MDKLSDSWQTPQDLFDVLNKGGAYQGLEFEGFNFNIDLCADESNHLCDKWFKDYLIADFKEGVGFCNPPYSNPKPFIEKAWEDSKHCKIVCLVKCDPSTRWWATFWNYAEGGLTNRETRERIVLQHIGPKSGCEVIFFPKRIKFDPPQQLIETGEVWRVGKKWAKRCENGHIIKNKTLYLHYEGDHLEVCTVCRGKGYRELSGPTFPSALLIFDRRGL